MGRKKKDKPFDVPDEIVPKPRRKPVRDPSDSSDSDDWEPYVAKHDLHPDIEQLQYEFKLSEVGTQELNDVMIDKRKKTWDQDLERLYELLRAARKPKSIIVWKIDEMKKGQFAGKAKCHAKVDELCKKHGVDKGATSKLKDAMAIREGLGKDVMNDLMNLDEHLRASNKPSALISQKLESLRKGYPIGTCIYSRAMVVGGSGIEGVVDKQRGSRPLGMSDRDLEKRFAMQEKESRGGGQLMDEAAVLRMMKADRMRDQVDQNKHVKKKRGDGRRSPSRGRKSPSYECSRETAQSSGRKERRSRSRSYRHDHRNYDDRRRNRY